MRLTAAILALCSAAAAGQQDSSRSLDRVVVTAERSATILNTASAAVTRLSAAELARVPHATVADFLKLVPGFALVDFDGLGRDPQIMARGFYGGGEAEYAVVLVDGKPVNGVHNGVISWHLLPAASSIAAIEIVRGGASALYGDAAVGAVINILTRSPTRRTEGALVVGSFGAQRGSALLGSASRSVAVAAEREDGFRSHAERGVVNARFHATRARGGTGRQSFTATASWRDSDEPGPLLESLARQDRSRSDELFRFDQTRDVAVGASFDHTAVLEGVVLTAAGTADYRDMGAVRTIALAPGFGDTKARDLLHRRVAGVLQADVGQSPLAGFSRLTLGADASYATTGSVYYDVATGDRDAYRAASGRRGNVDAAGAASRASAALFAHYGAEPTTALRLSLGIRGDVLRDRFDPRAPTTGLERTTTHAAISPKIGANLRYARGTEATGHLYLNAGTSFKAPTLDQLFDQRSIPLPVPPFRATVSNDALDPQRGTSVEGGLYHAFIGRGTIVSATVGIYQMDMRDELDFDVTTLRYVNIGRSRHRGFEAGVTVSMPFTAPAYLTYARQSVTARRGQFAGRSLKAIPRHLLNVGFPLGVGTALDPRVIVSHTGGVYLDDANARRLPSYTRVDMQWTPRVRGATLVIEARNVFNAEYSTTGFLDPSGSGEAYLYPAAGRVLHLGVRFAR